MFRRGNRRARRPISALPPQVAACDDLLHRVVLGDVERVEPEVSAQDCREALAAEEVSLRDQAEILVEPMERRVFDQVLT